MSTFQLLKTGNEPLLDVGQYVFFKGNTWDVALRNKVFRITQAATTHYRKDFGIFSTSGANSDEIWTVDDEIRPNVTDSLFQVRAALIGAAHLYIRYPSGRIRGGLEKGTYATPDPDSTTMRLLADYTEKDLENHNLEFFEAYGKGPDFEIKNFIVDSKVVLDMVIREMKIEEVPGYNGKVDAILEDTVEGAW